LVLLLASIEREGVVSGGSPLVPVYNVVGGLQGYNECMVRVYERWWRGGGGVVVVAWWWW
jgi:hypothetical protein